MPHNIQRAKKQDARTMFFLTSSKHIINLILRLHLHFQHDTPFYNFCIFTRFFGNKEDSSGKTIPVMENGVILYSIGRWRTERIKIFCVLLLFQKFSKKLSDRYFLVADNCLHSRAGAIFNCSVFPIGRA